MMHRLYTLFLCAIFLISGCASSPETTDERVNEMAGTLTENPTQLDQVVFQDSDIIPIGKSPARGPLSAPVTIVAFSDFQCPFCQRAVPTIAQVEKTFPDDVKVVFKQNPLPMHPQADEAARAAVAADRQGKFWLMHDWLFANQNEMREHAADFEDWAAEYAEMIGLDVERFRRDFNAPETREIIARDRALAEKLGARGTPYFFINGERLVGAQSFKTFVEAIRDQMSKVNALRTDDGKMPVDVYAQLVAENYERALPQARLPSGKDAPQKPAADAPEPRVDTSGFTINPNQVKGPKDAKVTIFAFSDFQCPFCQRGDENLKAALAQVDDSVRVVFKHFPLPFHKAAGPAAMAAIAAGEQGKFWEMHDLLFERQKELSSADESFYVELAKDLKLDVKKFKKALNKEASVTQIQEDVQQGQAAGVRGTPAFFIDGIRVVGAQPPEVFVEVIKEALSEKQ